jgi:dienelactone hydrolase
MTEVVLFHHALGLTDGVVGFADTLRAAGHVVHTPDLFAGRTFPTVEDGVAHAQEVGFDSLLEAGVAAGQALPAGVVHLGCSLGVLPAQRLAQTRPGALGALLLYSFVAHTEFGPTWPSGVPVQIHAMDADPFFVEEGDLDAARALVETTPDAELFLYPGTHHLFAEQGSPYHVPQAAALLTERVLAFLERVAPSAG